MIASSPLRVAMYAVVPSTCEPTRAVAAEVGGECRGLWGSGSGPGRVLATAWVSGEEPSARALAGP
eukprot:6402987-Prymnesium_polylepis.1